jgi:DNA-directed RNA polymerase specialized sigma24 family protein
MTLVMAEDTTLRDAMAGDPAPFDALLAPLLDPANRLAAVLLGDRTEAEDAVQEPALKAWSRLRQTYNRTRATPLHG